jgi:hypothetical protein
MISVVILIKMTSREQVLKFLYTYSLHTSEQLQMQRQVGMMESKLLRLNFRARLI